MSLKRKSQNQDKNEHRLKDSSKEDLIVKKTIGMKDKKACGKERERKRMRVKKRKRLGMKRITRNDSIPDRVRQAI
jgi:hypothetical protein